ncbi:transposase [Uniformispora flossi]|uniref:transposase n=1 Tax=Uniformispora flossi TaxID=3390723 RepID=UPI003C2F00C4
MGVRGGLTDGRWKLIEPLLPDRTPRRGGQWTDHREVIDAVAFKYRNNLAWRDLPGECPPWQTVFDRFTRWGRDGTPTAAADPCGHRRTTRRPTPIHRRHGRDPGPAAGRKTACPPRCDARRQGLLLEGDRRPPAQTRHPCCLAGADSGTGRGFTYEPRPVPSPGYAQTRTAGV